MTIEANDIGSSNRRRPRFKRSIRLSGLFLLPGFGGLASTYYTSDQSSFCVSGFPISRIQDITFSSVANRVDTFESISRGDSLFARKGCDDTVEKSKHSLWSSPTSDDDACSISDRRGVLVSIAASAFASSILVLSVPAEASSLVPLVGEKDPMQQYTVVGQWKALDRSVLETKNRNTRVPASFCTYLARFLICYDTVGVGAWWREQEYTYRLLSSQARDVQLSKSFSRVTKSIDLAIEDFFVNSSDNDPKEMYTRLWDVLDREYGYKPDAKRQIALLFSLLPSDHQPTSRLLVYYENLQSQYSFLQRASNDETMFISDNTWKEDLKQLLPREYRIERYNKPDPSRLTNSYYFRTFPNIGLDEVGITTNESETLNTVFGPLGKQPMIRDRPMYSLGIYSLFGLAGASSCALTHAVVIPLDVVKTRAQTDPNPVRQPSGNNPGGSADNGLLNAGIRILEKEGISGLFLGAQATLVGYIWYGLSVYPSYAFFKRYLTHDMLPIDFATAHGNEIALISGALAAVVASFGVTPMEAARIRVVAEPQRYRPLGLTGTLAVIATEDPVLGWTNLYAGLPPLLIRQVIFGSVKFVAFERACDYIFSIWPSLRGAAWTALVVSLIAGGFSGVLASVVSQPADSVLTYVAARSNTKSPTGDSLSIVDGVRTMVAEDGFGSLFRGLGSRCVWAGSIIAGQFFLYDIARTAFHVTPADLSQIYEFTFPVIAG